MATREQWLIRRLKETAKDVLLMAATGNMPDSFWYTDKRILRACAALKWEPGSARQWAREHI